MLTLKPVKTRVVVKPGQMKSGTLTCPPQTTPAGAAVDLDPGRAKSVDSFAGAALSLRASTASLRAFQFRIANTGDRAHDALVQGNCATVLLAPDVGRARLSTKISTYTDVIAPGRHHVVHRCPSGWTALGAGYALNSVSVRDRRGRSHRRERELVGEEHRRLAGHGAAPGDLRPARLAVEVLPVPARRRPLLALVLRAELA